MDNYGTFGPEYSFADNIPLPGQIGVRTESSIGAIVDSVAGVNTYVDIIAFGGPTFFDKQNLKPMGIRYFLDTGMRCSNGSSMSEYFDGVTKGDILGTRVKNALSSAGLPGLQGLAPGILENARDGLDPRPIISAAMGSSYPQCERVECPVGDANGSIRNPTDEKPYILDPVQWRDGRAWQTRWVQAYDEKGAPLQMSKEAYANEPKCYNADGSYMENPPIGCSRRAPPQRIEKGRGRYDLCRVIRDEKSTEGFGMPDQDILTTVGLVVGGLALGAAVYYAIRKK